MFCFDQAAWTWSIKLDHGTLVVLRFAICDALSSTSIADLRSMRQAGFGFCLPLFFPASTTGQRGTKRACCFRRPLHFPAACQPARRCPVVRTLRMSRSGTATTDADDVSGTIGSGGESLVHPGRGVVRGGFGLEFLGVAGGIVSVVGILALPLLSGVAASRGLTFPTSRLLVALMSFAYGIILSRFDLGKMRKLKLTISFALITRFVCVPMVSHFLALALAWILRSLAYMRIPLFESIQLPNLSHALSRDVASGLLLLAVTPAGFSPFVSMLSPLMYPTLYAHLALLTFMVFPVLPYLSYWMNILLRQSKLLSVGGILPQVFPPPGALTLVLCTTAPVTIAVIVNKILPRRWVAVLGLLSLPIAWLCIAILTLSMFTRALPVGTVEMVCGLLFCGFVMLAMAVLGRLLGAALRLDVRAKRTLLLYLCSQGSAAASGLSRSSHAVFPFAASALLGVVLTYVMWRRWGEVVIRKSLHDV